MKDKIRKIIMIVCIAVFVVSTAGIIVYFAFHNAGKQEYKELADMAGLSDLSQLQPPTVQTDAPDAEDDEKTTQTPAQPENPEQTDAPEDETAPSDEKENEREYVEFLESSVALLASDPIAEALSQTTFAALKEKNADVIGWIYMPGTEINYPIMQAKDNDYYLYYTFDRLWNSSVGAIYMDYRNNAAFEDFHTIIYGHNLTGGTMFSDLNKFLTQEEYWKTHRSLYIATIGGKVYRYDVYAACEADVTGHTYRLGLTEDSGKQAYINYCLKQSAIDFGVVPRVDQQVLTLSTCTGHGHHSRCVVQAVLAMEFVESEEDLDR